MYMSITKSVKIENTYNVYKTNLSPEKIKSGLENGEFIITPTVDRNVFWIINKTGRRMAVIDNDGGWDSGEEVVIKINEGNCIKAEY